MKFYSYYYESFELLPRIAFIYCIGKRQLSFDWLWWGIEFDLRSKKAKRIEKLKKNTEPGIPNWVEVERRKNINKWTDDDRKFYNNFFNELSN
ncbi:MAG: hypothetical protein AAFZ15_17250 [Bacteroidota bacterium]